MTTSRRPFVATLLMVLFAMAPLSTAPAERPTADGHVVLLGDSIFDNKAYVGDGPAVIDQVRTRLGPGWKATLLAVDGDVTDDVHQQLKRLPADATHLVISVGGNDALMQQGMLVEPALVATTVFRSLADVQIAFGGRYAKMLDAVQKHKLPTAVCTIYDPSFDDKNRQEISVAALAVFNDRITREAFRRGLPMIDLRVLFTEPEDYANPIEPGVPGGEKIAGQIDRIVKRHDFSAKRPVVYGN